MKGSQRGLSDTNLCCTTGGSWVSLGPTGLQLHSQSSGTGGITVARPESWVQAKESQSPTTPEPSASIFPVRLRVQ